MRECDFDSSVAHADRAQARQLVFEDARNFRRVADEVILAVRILRDPHQQLLVELNAHAHRGERHLIAVLIGEIDARGLLVSLPVGEHQDAVEPVGREIFLDLIDRRAHPQRHLGAAADLEQIDIFDGAPHGTLVVDLVGADDHLGAIGEGDDRNLVLGRHVLGKKSDRLDHEFQPPLIVHRTRAVDYQAQVQWQPRAAACAASALRNRFQQHIQNEIFRAGKHILAARERFEAKRFCHLRCSPAQIVSVSAMLWQLKNCCFRPLGTNASSRLARAAVYPARNSRSRPAV